MKLPKHLAELPGNAHLVQGKGKAVKIQVRDGYRSGLERRAAQEWVLAQQPLAWHYEPVTFNLVGFKYTPDFQLIDAHGHVTFVEVKGWNKNMRADQMKFNAAAKTHRWARWCWLTWHKRDGWIEQWTG